MAHGNELLKTKYFYLKLPKDWLKNARIKKLRKIAGGDTYTIIYLKLMLMSINHDCNIIFEGIEKTLEEELALKLDEEVDNVKMTLAFLKANDLIVENENHDCQMIEARGMVGSETYGNIIRKGKTNLIENKDNG